MNRKIITIISFFLVIGICTGVFVEIVINQGDKSVVFQTLSNFFSINNQEETFFFETLFSYVLKNLTLVVLLMLSPMLIITIPFSFLIVLFKGLSIGFSSAMVFDAFGLKGIGIVLLTIFPQCAIQLPVYSFLAATALMFWFTLTNNILNKRPILKDRREFKRYFQTFAFGFILIVISNIFEVSLLLLST
ncbi:MAG: stage II sporulation protein M [Anaerovoracaceae bacterium]